MFTWLFRLLIGSALLAGALWLLRAAMKWWIDGPEVEPSTAPWPPLVDHLAGDANEGDRAGESSGVNSGGAGATNGGAYGIGAGSANGTGAGTAPGISSAGAGQFGLASNGAAAETAAVPPDAPDRTWVHLDEADDALMSHPVKAKESSRLYHLPGMLAYVRTRPDRCYPSAEAAEADGFVRAKR